MKANMIVPIASVQGKIAKGYYARVLNGKQIIQRCPVRHKPPTPAQLNIRKQFGERFGTARKYLHTEEKSEDNEGSGMYGVVSWWYRGGIVAGKEVKIDTEYQPPTRCAREI